MFQIHTILVLIASVQCTRNRVLPYQFKRSSSVSAAGYCDSSNSSALIEAFFSVIFTEFYRTPPHCVCIQMCADQPTYCYPNGCLKVTESKRTETRTQPINNVQVQAQNANFGQSILDSHAGLLNSFFDESAGETRASQLIEGSAVTPIANGIKRPDPFKDKYKSLFKFRKTPKVHLRYNLREQIRNTKSDKLNIKKIDVDKWPINSGQFFFDSLGLPKTHNKGTGISDSDAEALNSPQFANNKYFKRDLVKAKNNTEIETENMDLTLNRPFSLENFIENLIESSFGPLQNETEIELNVNIDNLFNFTTKEAVSTEQDALLIKNSIKNVNKLKDIVSVKTSKQNVDKIKYSDTSKSKEATVNVYNDMIGDLIKSIEKRNNNSMELMELYLGRKMNDTDKHDRFKETSVPPNRKPTSITKISNEVTRKVTDAVTTKTDSATRRSGQSNVKREGPDLSALKTDWDYSFYKGYKHDQQRTTNKQQ